MQKIDYKEILFRLGKFRIKHNLSARETSLRLGYSDSFINRIERQSVDLKVKTLLEFLELIEVSPEEFFYPTPENYKKDLEILNLIQKLSKENKDRIVDLIKNLK